MYTPAPQMDELLSGGTGSSMDHHTPLETSLGEFEVLGTQLENEGTDDDEEERGRKWSVVCSTD